MPAIRSIWTGSDGPLDGQARLRARYPGRLHPVPRSRKLSGSSLTRRRCLRSRPDPDRPRRPGYGLMPGMTDPSVAVVRRWSPIASKIAALAIGSPGI